MRKALYLIPVILLALCAAHISLHNDTVSHNPSGDLTSLKPSHWKTKDFEINASFSLAQAQSASNNSSDSQIAAAPLSQGAKFSGFPFGFYFSNDLKTSVSSTKVSAYSWLWALVDTLLIVLTLLLAFLFNKKAKAPELQIFAAPDNPPVSPVDNYMQPPISPQPPQTIQPQSSPTPPEDTPLENT